MNVLKDLIDIKNKAQIKSFGLSPIAKLLAQVDDFHRTITSDIILCRFDTSLNRYRTINYVSMTEGNIVRFKIFDTALPDEIIAGNNYIITNIDKNNGLFDITDTNGNKIIPSNNYSSLYLYKYYDSQHFNQFYDGNLSNINQFMSLMSENNNLLKQIIDQAIAINKNSTVGDYPPDTINHIKGNNYLPKNIFSGTIPDASTISSDCVLYFDMQTENSGVVPDLSQYGNNGLSEYTAGWHASYIDSSLEYANANYRRIVGKSIDNHNPAMGSFIRVPQTNPINASYPTPSNLTKNFTLMFWMRAEWYPFSDAYPEMRIISCRTGDGKDDPTDPPPRGLEGWDITIFRSDIAFECWDIGASGSYKRSSAPMYKNIVDGMWHFVCFVVDENSKVMIYVDGKMAGSYQLLGGVAVAIRDLYIGARAGLGGPCYYYDGSVGIVQIYKKALDDYDIQSLFKSTAWMYNVYADI